MPATACGGCEVDRGRLDLRGASGVERVSSPGEVDNR